MIDKELKNWLAMVDYDMRTAQSMFKTGHYVYVVFMCHLSIEKVLKAAVFSQTKNVPPKTHDLIALTHRAQIKPPQILLDFIGALNNASTATRYPHDLPNLVSSYPKTAAQEYLVKTQEVIEWIKIELKLEK